MNILISLLTCIAFTATQAKLQARQDSSDLTVCTDECTPLVSLAQQCGSTTCLCGTEIGSAVQDCASCVQNQSDSVDQAQLEELQSSLDGYQRACANNPAAGPSAPSGLAPIDASSTMSMDPSSIAAGTDSAETDTATPAPSSSAPATTPDSAATLQSIPLLGAFVGSLFMMVLCVA